MALSPEQIEKRRRMIARRQHVNLRAVEHFRADAAGDVEPEDDRDDDEIVEVDLGEPGSSEATVSLHTGIGPRVRKPQKKRRCSKCLREGCRTDRCNASSPPELPPDEAPPAMSLLDVVDE